ncbi:efflux transporter periplasmic adaptor subunit [Pseudoxanthomonas kalamensis DSM 18571]|uniref:efflux RND transporter periplasmic adaptor subunit n=1 Tax=Pseudoxanthomonas kalamensis TaxID=289483 RepID=UPI001390BE1C|nr:efflux RND transporter periplasmic adaptor subunit [Pseudoxanthomonas kalamensis]KAF1712226.1 efflux transporter periplasmic adaptor subunit [Pseudoxanthomonas kalamensis DSM 18571]
MSILPLLRKRTVGLVIALATLVLLAWWLWPGGEAPSQTETRSSLADDGSFELSDTQLRNQGIESAPVTAAESIPLPGLSAQANAPLDASAQAVVPYAGVVTRILVDEGATVHRGEPLARIQSRELLMAQADAARARGEADAAVRQARRDAALLAEGIISASRNEQSRARAAAAEAARRQAEGALAQVRPVAGGQAGEYALLAPMDGRVLRRKIGPGQAVEALQPAFVVAEPGPLDIELAVPVRVRALLAPGLRVDLPDGSHAAVVAVGADTDVASQSLRLRARVDGDAARYLPGQQFSASLWLPAPEAAWTVPTAALLPAGDGHVLYRIDGRRVRAVPVQALLGGDDSVSVVQATGLDAEARVVTRGTVLLKSLVPAAAME